MAEPGVGLMIMKRILIRVKNYRKLWRIMNSHGLKGQVAWKKKYLLDMVLVFFRWRVNISFFSLLGYVLFYYLRQSHYRKILLSTPPSLIFSMLTLSLLVNRLRIKSFCWYFKKHLTYVLFQKFAALRQ